MISTNVDEDTLCPYLPTKGDKGQDLLPWVKQDTGCLGKKRPASPSQANS